LSLNRNDYEPWVAFAKDSQNSLISKLINENCKIVRLGMQLNIKNSNVSLKIGVVNKSLFGRIKHFISIIRKIIFREIPRILSLIIIIKKNKIDLIHANNQLRSNWYAIWGGFISGVPVVLHERMIAKYGIIDRLTSKLVSKTISMSKIITKNILSQMKNDNIITIYEGVEVPKKNNYLFNSKDVKILFPGRIEKWKGQDILLKSIPKIKEKYPNIKFLFAGDASTISGKKYKEELIHLTKKLNIYDSVEFLGHIDDINALYREINIVVHCSIEPEPFGFIIIEAMSYGCAVISTTHGAPLEIIDNGKTGILVEPGNSIALCNAIISLIDNHDKLKEISTAAYQSVKQSFNVKKSTKDIEKIYNSLLQIT